ncbi:hypothetical protein Rhopal_005800-T1 [Rhodotorula paludigena]|uniref:G-patch domain-containing protein n=1 Tax=Rhodotorula paludigena TaxID=86838 RepID=A0AAV5GTD3_9BASI|nr:hypothetical protein Rhopal_005800-T1 [Rhodotorula paludigena]
MASARPAFIFSYNAFDPDIARLDASTSRDIAGPSSSRHSGLGAARSYGYGGAQGYAGQEGDDDWVPTYGPTTYRRGRIRFVPAKAAAFGVIPGSDGLAPTIDLKGKGKAVEASDDEGADDADAPDALALPPPSAPKPSPLTGTAVRGLYASIVGLHSAPASLPSSPKPPRDPDPPPPLRASTAPPKRKPAAAPPARPPERPAQTQRSAVENEDVLVLSSDSEDESARDDTASDSDDDDDDLVVMDPLTGEPEVRPNTAPTSSSHSSTFSHHTSDPSKPRLAPLLIHELLAPPSSSASPASTAGSDSGSGALRPFVPPTHYALKPDNPGWRILQRQGWREGGVLGAVPAPGSGAAPRGLKVPLRAKEKFDRRGLGGEERAGARVGKVERRRERERVREGEERERERRGRGARGMERVQKREERERKAMIAYMNRSYLSLPRPAWRLTLFGRCFALLAGEFLANAVVWIAAACVWGPDADKRGVLSLAVVAWTLGLRHGLDMDHIVAVDNGGLLDHL